MVDHLLLIELLGDGGLAVVLGAAPCILFLLSHPETRWRDRRIGAFFAFSLLICVKHILELVANSRLRDVSSTTGASGSGVYVALAFVKFLDASILFMITSCIIIGWKAARE